MAKTISVDVAHKLGIDEAMRRVRVGIGFMQEKFGDKLSAFDVTWGEARADLSITAMGHTLHGAMEFLPEAVRVSLDLPWIFAALGEKIVGKMAHHTEEMLALPPPAP